MSNPVHNLERIKEKLSLLGHEKVQIIAVTKNYPVVHIENLLQAGHFHFGENRIPETKAKISDLNSNVNNRVMSVFPHPPIFHYLAPLQSGNVRQVVQIYNYVHGVSSLSALKKLIEYTNLALIQKKNQTLPLKYFVQVRLTQEDTKLGGFTEEELKEILSFPETPVCIFAGLMTMGPQNFGFSDFSQTKKVFQKLRELRDKRFPGKLLNMGMSQDWEIAVDEGADMIRLGTLLFT